MPLQFWSLRNHAVLNWPISNYQVTCSEGKFFLVGRELLSNLTASAAGQTEAAPCRVGQSRAFGVLLRIGAFCALLSMLLFGPFANQAQAHGLHGDLTVEMPSNWAKNTETQSKAEAEGAQVGCGVNCCSATGCASAVLYTGHSGRVVIATGSRFALPGDSPAKPLSQSSLIRPPRA